MGIIEKIAPPKQYISADLKEQLNLQQQFYTIIHCTFKALEKEDAFIRIWPTTILLENVGNEKKLLQMDNMIAPPKWIRLFSGTTHHFTLYFEGLSKECTSFDFLEKINESGAFFVQGIQRNKTDIYRIDLSNTY